MHYKESLCEFMKPYAQRLSQTQPLPGDLSHRHTSASSSEIEDLFERGPQLISQPSSNSDNELTQYPDKREFLIPRK